MRTISIDDNGNLTYTDLKELDVNSQAEMPLASPVMSPESEGIKIEKETIKMSELSQNNHEEFSEIPEAAVDNDSVFAAAQESITVNSETFAGEPASEEPASEEPASEEPVKDEPAPEVKTINFERSEEQSAKLVNVAGPRAKEGAIAFHYSGNKPVKLDGGMTVLNVRSYRDQLLVVFAVNGDAGALQLSSVTGRVRDVTSSMSIEGDYIKFKDDVVAFKSTLEKYI